MSLCTKGKCIEFLIWLWKFLQRIKQWFCEKLSSCEQNSYESFSQFVENPAGSDVKRYLDGYPGQHDNLNLRDNIRFYCNEIGAKPDSTKIDDIHKQWWGNYELLEVKHTYIQWLFPIREQGLNSQAQILQLHEANEIKSNIECKTRLLRSFEMMLDFYGMELTSKGKDHGITCQEGNSREIPQIQVEMQYQLMEEESALENDDNLCDFFQRNNKWEVQFDHLNRSSHNYMRITRILKCLGELGFDNFQGPWVYFIMQEIYERGQLRNCLNSCLDYWLPIVRNQQQRNQLVDYRKRFN